MESRVRFHWDHSVLSIHPRSTAARSARKSRYQSDTQSKKRTFEVERLFNVPRLDRRLMIADGNLIACFRPRLLLYDRCQTRICT